MPKLHKQNEILFITTNINKYQEASRILSKHGIKIEKNDFSKIEIQNDNIEKIAVAMNPLYKAPIIFLLEPNLTKKVPIIEVIMHEAPIVSG